eukprot:360745-Chlamydomonas_euryale.AAC.1
MAGRASGSVAEVWEGKGGASAAGCVRWLVEHPGSVAEVWERGDKCSRLLEMAGRALEQRGNGSPWANRWQVTSTLLKVTAHARRAP